MANPHPAPNSPLKGEENSNFPPSGGGIEQLPSPSGGGKGWGWVNPMSIQLWIEY
jgi:hypothetical protein